MDKNEDGIPDFEDLDDEPQIYSKLVEDLEKTRNFLEQNYRQSLLKAGRIQTWSHFGLPNVAATNTPQLDSYMKTKVNNVTTSMDKELAKIKTFVGVVVLC